MGDWSNTVYVKCHDPARILAVLDSLFAMEGFATARNVSVFANANRAKRMQYRSSVENELWGVAVLRGVDGWSVVKTAPMDLLCESAPGRVRPRLAYLAFGLATEAFQIDVEDSVFLSLMECDRNLNTYISGMRYEDDDIWSRLHQPSNDSPDADVAEYANVDETPPEETAGFFANLSAPVPRVFRLIEELKPFNERFSINAHETSCLIGNELTGRDASYWGNIVQIESLFPLRSADSPDMVVSYFARDAKQAAADLDRP
jgi:hypothetical protein